MSRMAEMAAEQEEDDSEMMFYHQVECQRVFQEEMAGRIAMDNQDMQSEFEREYNEYLDKEQTK